ncbi:RNA-binding domain-containing protein [Fusobacterium sp.]|uniref:RNA-binding domain-containing protein n=1 Tax=Fusobacterium sp. TaxID=68766 RepID=UPI0026136C16|nr:RNA-binding domain-containing protein [Fusobacterium sp.]
MDIFELIEIGENSEIEFKKAKNSVPKDLWETYSAMANTNGGTIVLGIEERFDKDERFDISGVESVEKMLKDFWSTINGNKVNKNILMEENVEVININHKKVIKIEVPRASYIDKPIYLNNNPYNGTYKRNYEGDYKCSQDEVNAMFRDASEKGFDSSILEYYDMDDLDMPTVNRYRNRFSVINLNHAWHNLSDEEFLIQLGAMDKDRKTKKVWLTVAGLLMFGKSVSIRSYFPYFDLDYLKMVDVDEDLRYNERFTIDGRWESNLFNFFTIVINKLSEDIPIPFKLNGITRIDDTPVHRAIREAFVNAIVHGDYSVQGTLRIKKFKDRFEFYNPGCLKIPVADIYKGGTSKCRNPFIQKMFRMIGFGENIGSGFFKILKAWKEQQWAVPILEENFATNEVVLKLNMISLVPEVYMGKLKEIYGNSLDLLNADEIKILVTAITEDEVTNARMQCVTDLHPNDITEMLRSMVNRGLLIEEGFGRGKKYMINEEFSCEESDSSLDVVEDESKGKDVDNYEIILVNSKLNDVERDILNIIKCKGFTTTKINTESLEISQYKSIRCCNNLIEKGAIKKEGKGRNVKYVLVNQ